MTDDGLIANYREISPNEVGLLRRMLSVQFPGSQQLAMQLEGATVREIDSDGSIQFRITKDGAARVKRRVPVEAQFRDSDGDYVRALLHVVDGKLFELEFYKDGMAPICRVPNVSDWEIQCLDAD